MAKTINASKLFKRGSGAVSGANKISKFKRGTNLLGKKKRIRVKPTKKQGILPSVKAKKSLQGVDQQLKPISKDTKVGARTKISRIVKNVANVIEEPQERINPYTGEPYDVTAGSFNMDIEDRNNPEDPLRRLGFVVGGVARAGEIVRGVVQSPIKNLLRSRSDVDEVYPNIVRKEFQKEFNRLTESPVGTPQTVKEVLQNKTLQRLKQATETEISSTEQLALERILKRVPVVGREKIKTLPKEEHIKYSLVKRPIYRGIRTGLDTSFDFRFSGLAHRII